MKEFQGLMREPSGHRLPSPQPGGQRFLSLTWVRPKFNRWHPHGRKKIDSERLSVDLLMRTVVHTHTQVCAHTIKYKLKVFLKCSKAEKAVVIGRVSKPSPRKAVNSQTSSGTPQNRGPKGKVCTQESSERYSATQRISQEGGSPSTETTPCYSRVYSQAATVANGR